ncbi:putative permease [Escherichia coli]|uniref:Putative permease n=1 Tax=Escherichia coli TaxID=562 RepID=A0A376TU32_ECOLX|nr:putative permease [Escherichia coli]
MSYRLPGNTFSVRQLNHYIHYLQETGQPSSEYRLALWEKLGQPILTLAMILLAVPFTFSAPRSPGMGSRLAVGVIVGLLTWISYQIMVNLGIAICVKRTCYRARFTGSVCVGGVEPGVLV